MLVLAATSGFSPSSYNHLLNIFFPGYHSLLRAHRTNIINLSIRIVGNSQLLIDLSNGESADGTPIPAFIKNSRVPYNQEWNLEAV